MQEKMSGRQPLYEERTYAVSEGGARGWILYPAAALSLVSGVAHLWATPEHFAEWWGYGVFFLVAALAQGIYALGLLRWPTRSLFLAGIAGNLAILGLFGVVHTRGIPFFGPHAGVEHPPDAMGAVASTAELALVVALVALARLFSPARRYAMIGIIQAFGVGLVLHLAYPQMSQIYGLDPASHWLAGSALLVPLFALVAWAVTPIAQKIVVLSGLQPAGHPDGPYSRLTWAIVVATAFALVGGPAGGGLAAYAGQGPSDVGQFARDTSLVLGASFVLLFVGALLRGAPWERPRAINLWRPHAATALVGAFVAVAVLVTPVVGELTSTAQAQSAACDATSFNRTYHVAAIDVEVPFNRYSKLQRGQDGATIAENIDEHGQVYALQGDKKAIKNWHVQLGATPAEDPAGADNRRLRPRPLVIRANAGECVKVDFTNELQGGHDGLPANPRASMKIFGASYDAQSSDGSMVGFNEDTTVANTPGQNQITYYWQAPKEEGLYFFRDQGASAGSEADGGSLAHGLYGALAVEPVGSSWKDPETGQPLYTGSTDHNAITKKSGDPYLDADIVPGASSGEDSFRETVQISQDEIPGGIGMGFNYGSEPQHNREANMIPDGVGEEVSLSSWAYGDPSLIKLASGFGPWEPGKEDCGLVDKVTNKGSCYVSNVHHAYPGDPTKLRYAHAGPKETHVFHMHAHQWLAEPNDAGSNVIDSQTYGPGESFTAELIGGAGSKPQTIGDSIFHCHLYPHFADGFWSLFRVHDVLEDGTGKTPDGTKVRELKTLPDRNAEEKPTADNPGYPRFIPGEYGWRAPQAPGSVSEPSGQKDDPATLKREDLKPAERVVAGKVIDPGNTPLATLQQRLTAAEGEKTGLEGELAKAKTDLDSAKASLAKAQTDRNAAQDALVKAQSDRQAAQASLASAQTDLKAAQDALATVKTNRQATQDALSAAQTELQAVQASLAAAQTNRQATQASLASAEAQLKATLESLATAQTGRQATQASLTAAQAELKGAQDSLVLAQTELKGAQDSLVLAQTELKGAQDNLATAEADRRAAQEALATCDPSPEAVNNCEKLQAQIAALDGQIAQLNTQITALTDKVNQINTDVTALTAKVGQLGAQVTALTDKVNQLNADITAQDAEIARLNTQITTLEGQIAQLNAQAATQDAELAQLNAQVATLNTKIGDLTTQIAAQDAEIARLNTQITDITARANQLNTQIAALDGQIAQLGTQIAALDGQIAQLNSDVTNLGAKVADLPLQIAAKDTQAAILKKLIAERKAQNFNYTGSATKDGAIKPGAPLTDPCPTGGREVTYNVSIIQTDVVYNEAGWHDTQGRMVVLEKNLVKDANGNVVLDENGNPKLKQGLEPLFFRVNAGDCINFNLTNRLPNWFGNDAFQKLVQTNMMGGHIHLVKFDVLGSDGSSNGWNYQQAAFSKDQMDFNNNRDRFGNVNNCDPTPQGCILPNPPDWNPNVGHGAAPGQTIHERWYANTELKTVFTHDHHFAAVDQNRGQFGALIVEPKGVDFRNPKTGQFFQPGNASVAGAPTCGLACEGDAVGAAMDIIGPGTNDDFREFGLGIQDFVSLTKAGGDARNPADTFNPPAAPEHFPNEDPGIMGVNYRNAPFKLRDTKNGQPVDPAYRFSSWVFGDPKTPLLEAYGKDRIQFRLMQGSQEEQHGFTVHGMRWRKEPGVAGQPNTDSPLVNQQPLGISEAFNLQVPGIDCGADESKCQGDYLYSGTATDDIYLGMWGILRSYGKKTPDLLPLPDNSPGNSYTDPSKALKGKAPTSDALAPPQADGPGNPCPTDAPVRTFDVVAMEASIKYNKQGDHDPYGLIYALSRPGETADQTVARVRAEGKHEPLVIRANEGDCVDVNLTNRLTQGWLDAHPNAGTDGDPTLPLEGPAGTPAGLRVSLHPQLLKYDVRGSDGAAVGFNRDQTVGPGSSRTYRWYADNVDPGELGATNLTDYGDVRGHRHHGLFAGLNIEPKGSTYHDPVTGQEITSGAAADIRGRSIRDFREFTTFFQDGLNLRDKTGAIIEDPADHPPAPGEPAAALDAEDQGEKGFNYANAPFRHRLGGQDPVANPTPDANALARVFSSKDHGDPDTPIFRAYGGDPVRMRLLQGSDKPRQHSFQLSGHSWKDQPYDPNSNLIGTEGGITVGGAQNVFLPGVSPSAGDYRYGSGVGFHHLSGGLWGLMRVYQAPAANALSPTPIGATDDPRAGGHPIMPLEPDPIGIDLSLGANPSLLTSGAGTTLSGKLVKTDGTGISGRKVILEQRPVGQEGWTAVPSGTLTTAADNTATAANEAGNFSLAGVKPSKITDYRARFEGVATAGLDPAESETQRVNVMVQVSKPAVTFQTASGTATTTPKVGHKATIKGSVSPVLTGSVDVIVKYNKGSGDVFDKRMTVPLNASSQYTATYTVPTTGVYSIRTRYNPAAWGHSGYLGNISPASNFNVK